jgi:hypothetical protein
MTASSKMKKGMMMPTEMLPHLTTYTNFSVAMIFGGREAMK